MFRILGPLDISQLNTKNVAHQILYHDIFCFQVNQVLLLKLWIKYDTQFFDEL
jgi:hypothetical protein